MTINIGSKVVEEYFNVANVEHYNAILGTPFLRKMGIILDFESPGTIWMGNEVVLTRKVSFNSSKDTEENVAILFRTAELLLTRNEARRVDHRHAHPNVSLTKMRGSVLILG